MNSEEKRLSAAIEAATRKAAKNLFEESGECFYYFSLITSGEAHAPFVAAWSKERLATVPEEQRKYVKWSYADSPYCGYGAEFFTEVNELFDSRPDLLEMSESGRMKEYSMRVNAMTTALTNLDQEGVFGAEENRDKIIVNVEVMPPDYTNTERAIELNPSSAIEDWLKEAAE